MMRVYQNVNIILMTLQFDIIHFKRPFLYLILSKEMVF